jgi:hypothetical protein
MSARLKLKKLKTQLEFIRDACKRRELDAEYEKARCHKLLRENIVEIGALADLPPARTYQQATEYLDCTVRKVSHAIVYKYTEQLAEYIHDQLLKKYMLNNFATFGVRLLAPALTEDHIKIDIKEAP